MNHASSFEEIDDQMPISLADRLRSDGCLHALGNSKELLGRSPSNHDAGTSLAAQWLSTDSGYSSAMSSIEKPQQVPGFLSVGID